jgi:hypothetical protein
MVKAKNPPKAMIWAGIPFNRNGRVILTGNKLRAYYNRIEAHRDAHQKAVA